MNISKNLPVPAETSAVSFAEVSLPLPMSSCNSIQEDTPALSKPVGVLKADRFSIALSNDISEVLLSGILKEILHA